MPVVRNRPVTKKPKSRVAVKAASQPAKAKSAKRSKASGSDSAVSSLASALTQALTLGGGMASSLVGIPPPIGSALGAAAGKGFAHLMGVGDYTVNSLIVPGSERKLEGVQTVSFEKGMVRTRLRKREFVGYLQAPPSPGLAGSPFDIVTFRLNPGNTALFPYLSWGFPQVFKRWRPLGCVFELVSTATDYSTAVNLGVMGVSVDYDNHDPQFTSMTQALQAVGSVSAKISQNIATGLECAPDERAVEWLYVRNGGLPPNADVNLYDLCTVSFFTEGLSNTNGGKVAEIWVNYDFEFEYPLLNAGVTGSQCTTALSHSTSVSKTYPLGTSRTTYGSFPIRVEHKLVSLVDVDQLIFPPWLTGTFVVAYWGVYTPGGSSVSMPAPALSFGARVKTHGSAWSSATVETIAGAPFAATNKGNSIFVTIDILPAAVGGEDTEGYITFACSPLIPDFPNEMYLCVTQIDATLGSPSTPLPIVEDPWYIQ